MTTILLFVCAFALSGVAAFYSIAGLIAIFAGAPIPIAIMGSTLEASKLVVASWLYRNWGDVPKLLKGYLTCSLVILMLLTSMGIFGYLSKAHLEHGVPTADVSLKVEMIDQQIATEKDIINTSRKSLQQLDEQVNQTISRTSTQTNDNGIARSITVRKGQTKERADLAEQIQQSQAKIAELNQQRFPIAAELRKVEAEVGPIKYIAALMYGDQPGSNVLEKAVRWVTLMIVIVFDPLAVMLLIAANWSLANRDKQPVVAPVAQPEEQSKQQPPIESPVAETQLVPSEPLEDQIEPTDLVADVEQIEPTDAAINVEQEVVEQTTWTIEPPPTIDALPPENVDYKPHPEIEQFWRSRPKE